MLPKADTEKSKAILHAAERLFAEKGYHATSVDEIAKSARVSKGLVLYHFRSKVDLLQHLLIDNLTTISNQLETIRQTDMTARDKIQATVVAHINFGNRRLSLIQGALLAGPAHVDSTAHAHFHDLMEKQKLSLAGLIEDGVANGKFRPIDSNVAANMLLGAVHELIIGAALGGKSLPMEQAADEVTSLFCDGIGC